MRSVEAPAISDTVIINDSSALCACVMLYFVLGCIKLSQRIIARVWWWLQNLSLYFSFSLPGIEIMCIYKYGSRVSPVSCYFCAISSEAFALRRRVIILLSLWQDRKEEALIHELKIYPVEKVKRFCMCVTHLQSMWQQFGCLTCFHIQSCNVKILFLINIFLIFLKNYLSILKHVKNKFKK